MNTATGSWSVSMTGSKVSYFGIDFEMSLCQVDDGISGLLRFLLRITFHALEDQGELAMMDMEIQALQRASR